MNQQPCNFIRIPIPAMNSDTQKQKAPVQIRNISNSVYAINITPMKPPSETAPDKESLHGHFGWATIDQKHHLPYIIRDGEKYCAVRMVDTIVSSYNILTQDICSCVSVHSFPVTETERRLLNEINSFHCDYLFGKAMFAPKDQIVKLSDGAEMCKFTGMCFRRLVSNGSVTDICGFVLIDGASVVPYVMINAERFFPLFYFEGADHLQQRAKVLKGWPLTYLRLLFKIQGIREEYLKTDSCSAVSITFIKDCFPPNTEFKDFWPTNATTALQQHKGGAPMIWHRQAAQEVNYNIYLQPLTNNGS